MPQSQLRRLRFAPCGADIFADPVAGFIYPAFEALEVTTPIKGYERSFLTSDHELTSIAMGEKDGSAIKFTTEGRGFGGAGPGAGSAVAATDGENGLLFKSAFGNQQKDTGSVAANGTTASTIVLASTALVSVGGFIGCVDPATSLLHVRQVRAKTATDLTLDRALPFIPAIGATVYASAHYWHALEGHPALWFDAEGYDATAAKNWRRYLRGCIGDFAIKNLAANGRMMLEWDFKGVDWSDAGQGVSQGAPVYPANLPAAGGFVRSSRMHVGASELAISEAGFQLGNEIQDKPSTAAVNGVAEKRVVGYKPQITFKAALDDAETAGLRAAWKAGTALDLLLELTQGGPGNAFAIAAPAAQIADWKQAVVGGLDYVEVTCRILRSSVANVPAVTFGVL
jgi:hypothetical protein